MWINSFLVIPSYKLNSMQFAAITFKFRKKVKNYNFLHSGNNYKNNVTKLIVPIFKVAEKIAVSFINYPIDNRTITTIPHPFQ